MCSDLLSSQVPHHLHEALYSIGCTRGYLGLFHTCCRPTVYDKDNRFLICVLVLLLLLSDTYRKGQLRMLHGCWLVHDCLSEVGESSMSRDL